jgi:hypothetical protein
MILTKKRKRKTKQTYISGSLPLGSGSAAHTSHSEAFTAEQQTAGLSFTGVTGTCLLSFGLGWGFLAYQQQSLLWLVRWSGYSGSFSDWDWDWDWVWELGRAHLAFDSWLAEQRSVYG